jgi:hypothetical protein
MLHIYSYVLNIVTGSCKSYGKGPYPNKTSDHEILCPEVPAARCISSYSGSNFSNQVKKSDMEGALVVSNI